MKKSTKLKMGIAVLMAVIGLLFIGCPTDDGGGDGDTTYTVTFDANGGTFSDPSKASITVKEGESAVTLPTPTKTAVPNVFQRWYRDKDTWTQEFKATTPVTGDIIVYAKWGTIPVQEYTVTFDAKGGDPVSPITDVVEGTTLGALLPTPTKETAPNVFQGWYTNDGTGGNWGTPFTALTPVTAAITVYAKWGTSAPQYWTLTFNADGGTVTPATMQVIQGEAAGGLPVPLKSGNTFEGWYTELHGGGSAFTKETLVTADKTVHAKWAPIKYTVTFDSDGGSDVSGSNKEVNSGEAIGTLPTPTNSSGDTFGGWYTEKNGGGTRYTETTKVTGNITLYAEWIGQTDIINHVTVYDLPATLHDEFGLYLVPEKDNVHQSDVVAQADTETLSDGSTGDLVLYTPSEEYWFGSGSYYVILQGVGPDNHSLWYISKNKIAFNTPWTDVMYSTSNFESWTPPDDQQLTSIELTDFTDPYTGEWQIWLLSSTAAITGYTDIVAATQAVPQGGTISGTLYTVTNAGSGDPWTGGGEYYIYLIPRSPNDHPYPGTNRYLSKTKVEFKSGLGLRYPFTGNFTVTKLE
jgi:uncharacterized repeat protein (TIGR02543 family)